MVIDAQAREPEEPQEPDVTEVAAALRVSISLLLRRMR